MTDNQSIISPVPGVFYRKPSPEKDVFFNEGDAVKAGDVIGLIEVMKNFYEIKAEADGVIERFLVENEDIVDAGQELAVLK
ncbi:acetyl-CoA carboxylase [Aneurinibacillus sp. REN35]|uniref:acetyl-CoA carboxylase n=1 Tax=Aneurinibacillus sp. REN35 TaxID=3237286 RepID=UPI0035275FB8